MKLRRSGLADAPWLSELMRRSILELGPRHYTPAQVEAWAASVPDAVAMAARLGDGRTAIVAVDDAGAAVAFGDLEAGGHIDLLFALPQSAGKGVAGALLDALEMVARSEAMMRLTIEASEAAKGLCGRHGFALLARNELTLDGVAIHNWRMEKPLQRQGSSQARLPLRD